MSEKRRDSDGWQDADEFFAHEAARIVGEQDDRPPDTATPKPPSQQSATMPEPNWVFEFNDKWRRCPACGEAIPQSHFVERLTLRVFRRSYRTVKPHRPFECPVCNTSVVFRRPATAQMAWPVVAASAAIGWGMVYFGVPEGLADNSGAQVFLLALPVFTHGAVLDRQRTLMIVDGMAKT